MNWKAYHHVLNITFPWKRPCLWHHAPEAVARPRASRSSLPGTALTHVSPAIAVWSLLGGTQIINEIWFLWTLIFMTTSQSTFQKSKVRFRIWVRNHSKSEADRHRGWTQEACCTVSEQCFCTTGFQGNGWVGVRITLPHPSTHIYQELLPRLEALLCHLPSSWGTGSPRPAWICDRSWTTHGNI